LELTITGKAQTATDLGLQEALRERGEIPRHVAVIMDGNGRWARQRGQDRIIGHHEGVESVRDITEACAQLGVQYLTLYTFSTENWNRPPAEVTALMALLVHTLRRETETLRKNHIRLRPIGDLGHLPEACRAELDEACEATVGTERMDLILAMSYSGRWEIARAAREIARQAAAGTLDPEAVDEPLFARFLPLPDVPDPDLLIRTGGEFRVSNFLLWQIAYTEIYITDLFWPAFRREQLYEAIRDFQDRDRRFGRVKQA
jgi:undecaprenyl diphosphate synthase